ncbi:TylF/MycF/NovP-related O-methyltransferase [Nocardia africana]|uniref:Macrocin-O-methyltransferase (TylF) n=1 Tax=Nocardia africana TaxID=134964 RepID=A0A378WZI2_9NOCA|nr:TylF/MycF/NovP-related O-methyltransferase [Nocardia africana]MCC3312935.1 TylF/MycF family methyltransferase [Nocardia africana]SUA45723.1 Macrocin-O-methyltransferase (TylF) [Nocardia africana]
MTTYRTRPGTFLAWGIDGVRLGHSDSPLDLREVTPAIVEVLSRFSQPARAEQVVAELGAQDTNQAVGATIDHLVAAGLLCESEDQRAADASLRVAAMEVPRALGTFPDIRHLDPEFIELYESVQHTTQTSVAMSYALRLATKYVTEAGIPGDVVECGVWRGGSAAIAAATLFAAKDLGRTIWLYDTFTWTWDEPSDLDQLELPSGATKLKDLLASVTDSVQDVGADEESVLGTVAGTGYPREQIRCVAGLVQETIPEHAPGSIAILRLDTDLYDSTRHELEHLYPLLSVGGVLIVDDYGKYSGATRAVDEYFAKLNEPILLHRIDTQGRICVKTTAETRPTI